jgi:hypothetical protein
MPYNPTIVDPKTLALTAALNQPQAQNPYGSGVRLLDAPKPSAVAVDAGGGLRQQAADQEALLREKLRYNNALQLNELAQTQRDTAQQRAHERATSAAELLQKQTNERESRVHERALTAAELAAKSREDAANKLYKRAGDERTAKHKQGESLRNQAYAIFSSYGNWTTGGRNVKAQELNKKHYTDLAFTDGTLAKVNAYQENLGNPHVSMYSPNGEINPSYLTLVRTPGVLGPAEHAGVMQLVEADMKTADAKMEALLGKGQTMARLGGGANPPQPPQAALTPQAAPQAAPGGGGGQPPPGAYPWAVPVPLPAPPVAPGGTTPIPIPAPPVAPGGTTPIPIPAPVAPQVQGPAVPVTPSVRTVTGAGSPFATPTVTPPVAPAALVPPQVQIPPQVQVQPHVRPVTGAGTLFPPNINYNRIYSQPGPVVAQAKVPYTPGQSGALPAPPGTISKHDALIAKKEEIKDTYIQQINDAKNVFKNAWDATVALIPDPIGDNLGTLARGVPKVVGAGGTALLAEMAVNAQQNAQLGEKLIKDQEKITASKTKKVVPLKDDTYAAMRKTAEKQGLDFQRAWDGSGSGTGFRSKAKIADQLAKQAKENFANNLKESYGARLAKWAKGSKGRASTLGRYTKTMAKWLGMAGAGVFAFNVIDNVADSQEMMEIGKKHAELMEVLKGLYRERDTEFLGQYQNALIQHRDGRINLTDEDVKLYTETIEKIRSRLASP